MHNTDFSVSDKPNMHCSLSILPKHPVSRDTLKSLADSLLDSLRINASVISPRITLVKPGITPLVRYRFALKDSLSLSDLNRITSAFSGAEVSLRCTRKTPSGTSRSLYAWTNK